ncbi:MAG: hypothetical protein A2173_06820 [Planctomycetes bacterium RBG_13_44_8b]|nr:MAG: hypothetical protein A2173_06820 [Planctomycetes bacterium RBG_13_44_8b]
MINKNISADEIWIKGPEVFLDFVQQLMNEYHSKTGKYPPSFEELDSLYPNNDYFHYSKGENYTYEIITVSKDFYHVVSKNNEGLRNYKITSEMRYPMMIFKDEKDRKKAKKTLLKKLKEGAVSEQRDLINTLRHFPDKDIKLYLIKKIKDVKEDERVKYEASYVLKDIAVQTDNFLISPLLDILAHQGVYNSAYIKLNILHIFAIIKDPVVLPAVHKLADEEKDMPYYPIKTTAENLIKELEDEKRKER